MTDANTADAPLELTVTQEMGQGNDGGLGSTTARVHTFRNIQVDSAAAEAGLYIKYSFPVYEDHDLYVYYADGAEAAHVGGFNQVSAGPSMEPDPVATRRKEPSRSMASVPRTAPVTPSTSPTSSAKAATTR